MQRSAALDSPRLTPPSHPMPVIETALTRLLGIEHPILLAPMGSAAGGKLAAAVTNAGGLGLIGSGYANADAIRKELTEAGNTRVGIGFILWALERNPSALDVALDAKPAAVMLYSAYSPNLAHSFSRRYHRAEPSSSRKRPMALRILVLIVPSGVESFPAISV